MHSSFAGLASVFCPRFPWVCDQRVFAIRLQEFGKFAALLRAEARANPNLLQSSRIVEEAEHQRADQGTISFLLPPKCPTHAVAVASVFDFKHSGFVRLVGSRSRLSHATIEARALKATKPVGGHVAVAGSRRQMDRWRRR